MTADDDRPQFYRDFFPGAAERRPSNGQPLDAMRAVPYAMRAIHSELDTLGMCPEGGRNAQLNASAFNLAQLVAGGLADHTEVWNLLRDTALGTGLTVNETDATLHSAFNAGMLQPRKVPDLPTTGPPQVTVVTLDTGGVVAEEPKPPPVEVLFPSVDWDALFAEAEEDEWVLYPLIPARRLVALFSPPKVGKSLLMLEVAVQISRGHTVLGQPKVTPRRVLYVDYENDPRGDIRPRLEAMGMTPYQLRDLNYLSFPALPGLDTPMGGAQLLAAVEHYESEVVIIDTVGRVVLGEENSNDTWLGFYKHTGMRLKSLGVACVRLDHTGKDATKGMRGGSAKYSDVDLVWSLSKVTDDTLRLECTANRLEVGEKVLVLHREEMPNLYHRVDARGEVAAWVAKDEESIRLLDNEFGTAHVGVNKAQAYLREKDKGRQRAYLLSQILPERERRHGRHQARGGDPE